MGEKNIVTNEERLRTNDLLKELPIGITQLRTYIKDGRLPAKKIRNKYYTTRREFNQFKQAMGF